jgi:hypothetical protein
VDSSIESITNKKNMNYKSEFEKYAKSEYGVSSLKMDYHQKKGTTDPDILGRAKLFDDLLSYESIIGKSEVDSRIYFMKKSKLDFPKLLANYKKLYN